ncbi:MAG: hypothetical protein IJ319_01975, partial [Bacteroidaceae bacterium]|nr:hypothetical protein [Bacteroidaceae bacterium]
LLIRLLLAASILSAVYRVLRNSLRSNMLALFPAYGRDLRSLAYGAGCFFRITVCNGSVIAKVTFNLRHCLKHGFFIFFF